MSAPDEERNALVTTQSAALGKAGANVLAARGRNFWRDKEEARRLLEHGKELAAAWVSRSDRLLREGRTHENVRDHNQQRREEERLALECYEQSFGLDPANPETAYWLAESYRSEFISILLRGLQDNEQERRYHLILSLYRSAAEAGVLDSQTRLAEFLLMHGDIAGRNEARDWLVRAASRGDAAAQEALNDLERGAS